MSFLIGAACAAVAPAAFDKIAAMRIAHSRYGANFTDVRWMNDPLALPRMYRDNRLFSHLDFAINRPAKQSHVESWPAAIEPATEANANDGVSMASEAGLEEQMHSANLDDASEPSGPEAPDQDRMAMQPSLYFDPVIRKPVIGNFKTRSFPGDDKSCVETARSMISDASAGQNSLLTLADTKEIKVMKICAANGIVIVTCRHRQVTISPRRSRPNDGCGALQILKQSSKAL